MHARIYRLPTDTAADELRYVVTDDGGEVIEAGLLDGDRKLRSLVTRATSFEVDEGVAIPPAWDAVLRGA